MKQFIKRLFFGEGVQQKKILFGSASGIKMNISLNHKLQRYWGLEEKEIQRSFRKFAKMATVFVDIGASDGYYGLMYYKFSKNGNLFLCDADPLYAQQQKDHFSMNGFATDNVHFVTKFISNRTDDTNIALDDLLKNVSGTTFFKIDVDGGELHVLKGMENVLANRDCKIIVETHSRELENSCITYLQAMGYRTTVIPNAWWRVFVPELRPIEHNRWFSAEKK